MHEKNIALLCDEAERLLTLNINLLNTMLDEPNLLTDKADKKGDELDRSSASKRVEELNGEKTKLTRKEMVLAIVGTMKAGKSTTINAIVGKEILPNRNRPMTSIPTLIRHVPGKATPELQLNNIEPVRELLVKLAEKTETAKNKKLANQTLFELSAEEEREKNKNKDLLTPLINGFWLKNIFYGEKEIYSCLAALNDLVRLCTALKMVFPFDAYAEVHKLPVIEVEFSHLPALGPGMDKNQGTLALLDTPGPNEAEQPQLKPMMRDQLRKASAVLAVMDYTQMKSDADKEVREELNSIAKVSAGRMFVLVNKFDQKNANSDSAETVKQIIPNMLKNALDSERVYPGSSLRAYLANRARGVVAQGGTLSISEEWVKDFGDKAFGCTFEEEDLADNAYVLKGADKLWRSSLFDKLITEVIQSVHANSAMLAVESAADKLMENTGVINEFLSIRHQALSATVESLQTQVDGLFGDMEKIRILRDSARDEVDNTMKKITSEASDMLSKELKRLEKTQQKYFANFESKEEKFSEKKEAILLLKQIDAAVNSLFTESNDEIIKPKLDGIITKNKNNILESTAIKQLDDVARSINARFNEDGFNVTIKFPQASRLQTNLSDSTSMLDLLEERTEQEWRRRRSDSIWGSVCRWFNTDDWGWEDYRINVSRSVVNINKIQDEVATETHTRFKALKNDIDVQINKPLEKEINEFFKAFENKVQGLANTLAQSIDDHKIDQLSQEKLAARLLKFKEPIPAMIVDSDALMKDLKSIKS